MTTYRAWNLKPLDRSALKELTAAIAQQSTEELESRAMETMDGEPQPAPPSPTALFPQALT